MRRLLLALSLMTAACGGRHKAAYSLAYRTGYGNALAPPSTSSGRSSSISYREYGGPIGKALLLWLFVPQLQGGSSSSRVVGDSTSCGGGECTRTITTETTYTPPTAEQIAEYKRELEEYNNVTAPAIRNGAIKAEVNLDVATRSLGGDTSGLSFQLLGVLLSEQSSGWTFALKAGFGASGYTMGGRTTKQILSDGMETLSSVHLDSKVEDVSSTFFGVPVRVILATPLRFAAYGEFDWNLLRAVSGEGTRPGQTYHPQLTTFGLQTSLWFMHVGAEVQLDQLNLGSRTFGVEAGLAF